MKLLQKYSEIRDQNKKWDKLCYKSPMEDHYKPNLKKHAALMVALTILLILTIKYYAH